jgi:hypothetical protein
MIGSIVVNATTQLDNVRAQVNLLPFTANSSGTLTNNQAFAGGLVGVAAGTNVSTITIQDSWVGGTNSGVGKGRAGLIGSITSGRNVDLSNLIDNTQVEMDIIMRLASPSNSDHGGMIGYTGANLVIKDSTYSGTMSAQQSPKTSADKDNYWGGAVGVFNELDSVQILDSTFSVYMPTVSGYGGETAATDNALPYMMGGVIGMVNTSNVPGSVTISGVQVYGSIAGSRSIGGFIGRVAYYNNQSSPTVSPLVTIVDSVNDATVSGWVQVGGMVGMLDAGSNANYYSRI